MLIAAAIAMILVAFAFPLIVRKSHIPEQEAISPTLHLEDRKAVVYMNLRDLRNEFQMGKLSKSDYAASKQELQKELAGVLAEIERIKGHEDA